MRKTINVLWLDDNRRTSERIINYFKDALQSMGYSEKLIYVKSVDDATKLIKAKKERVDFFVSDFNLNDNDNDGVRFLEDIRKSNYFKQFFILYSNIAEKTLLGYIKERIANDSLSIESLNNFSFTSIADNSPNDLKKYFTNSIKIALVRWEELAALRGEYASFNSLADDILKSIFILLRTNGIYSNGETSDYYEKIEKFREIIDNEIISCKLDQADVANTFAKWNEIRKIRNSLEHNPEKWDDQVLDYYVINKSNSQKMYEKDSIMYRMKIINASKVIKELLADIIEENDILECVKHTDEYSCFFDMC